MKKIIVISSLLLISCQNSKIENGEKYFKQSEDYIIKQNYKKANESIDKALGYNANNSKYLHIKLNILLEKCNKKESLEVIDKLLKQSPDDYSLLTLKYLLLKDDKDLSREAKACLNDAYSILSRKVIQENKRGSSLANFVFILKLMGKSNIELKKEAEKLDLSTKELQLWNSFVNLDIEDNSFSFNRERCK